MITATEKDWTILPQTAYGMFSWQLDAWESTDVPEWLGLFEVFRGPCGTATPFYDGYVLPADLRGSAYVMGWLDGRQQKAKEGMSGNHAD